MAKDLSVNFSLVDSNGNQYNLDNVTIENSINSTPQISGSISTADYTINVGTSSNCTTNSIYTNDTTSSSVLTYNGTGLTWIDPYSITCPPTNTSTTWIIQDTVDKLKEKENEEMNDFNFGPFNTQNIRLSPYGMALKNKSNKWVSYNPETKQLIDVDVINIEIESSKIFYKVPRALNEVKVGDIILHNNNLVFVEAITGNRFLVINPYEGTELTILPSCSPFGFDYITVIISLADYLPAASENQPFGNLLPFMLGKNNSNLALLLASGQKLDPMTIALIGGGDLSAFLLMDMFRKNNKEEVTK